MSRVLVSGGAGLIGSHLCDSLLRSGHEVTCIDNFSSGRSTNLVDHEDNRDFSLIETDVRAPPSFGEEFDSVYHLASQASPVDFKTERIEIAVTISEGTHKMLELARDHEARFLLASTSEVYGDPEVHPQKEEYWGKVNPRGPRAIYDEGKRFAEAIASAYVRKHSLDVRTVRIFNTYGPRMRHDDGRAVPNFLSQALEGRDLTVYADGSQTRSFCYVTDLVDGLVAAMETGGLQGEVLNLGNPDERTILELAEVVTDVVDTDSGITYRRLPEDDPQRRKPDISQARSKLDWAPSVDLRAGIKRTAEYYQNRR